MRSFIRCQQQPGNMLRYAALAFAHVSSYLSRQILGDDTNLEALDLGNVLVGHALLREVGFEPVHEPDEEVRRNALERQDVAQQRTGGRRAASEHLADEE